MPIWQLSSRRRHPPISRPVPVRASPARRARHPHLPIRRFSPARRRRPRRTAGSRGPDLPLIWIHPHNDDRRTMTTDNHGTTPSVTELVEAAEEVIDLPARFRLDGRRYVVLGGGRGMGKHTSHSLAQLGAQVVVVDSDQERAYTVAADIGDAAVARVVDATSDGD